MLAVNWSIPLLAVATGAAGLVIGHLLHIRQWLRQKRVDLYDEFLRAFREAARAHADLGFVRGNLVPDERTTSSSAESNYETDLKARVAELLGEELRRTEHELGAFSGH
jgi:hypothetical protein